MSPETHLITDDTDALAGFERYEQFLVKIFSEKYTIPMGLISFMFFVDLKWILIAALFKAFRWKKGYIW